MTNEERATLIEEVRASAEKIEQGRDHLGVAKVYRFLLGELDEATRERNEARSQLAALHAAASRFRDAVSDDGFTCRDNGIDSAEAVEEEWEAIDRTLADLATAAAEHELRVREQGIMEGRQEMRDTATVAIEAAKRRGEERDQFAAALAEVRAASVPLLGACLANDRRQMLIAADSLNVVLSALPADLAAQREARIRADERATALREAADDPEVGLDPRARLRAMADEAERRTR